MSEDLLGSSMHSELGEGERVGRMEAGRGIGGEEMIRTRAKMAAVEVEREAQG